MSICVPLNVPGCVYAFVGNVESERVHANLNWSYLDACLSVCCVLERDRMNLKGSVVAVVCIAVKST